MANEKLVARLRQGVAEWNAWREKSALSPDLSGADLSGENLGGANLRVANLGHANLNHTNLSYANLQDANLSYANLNAADLGGADLGGADLGGADLTDADLTGVNLTDADLRQATLGGTNLTAAYLWETLFINVDLTRVIGLETCIHRGPSVVDYRNLQKSSRLPSQFLRGVGLPDRFIEYLPSLLDQAIQYYSCFISYSTKDQDFADRIYADLQNNGVRCWFAPHDMPIGGKILDETDLGIRLRDKVLLILSEHSIKSDWVEDEVMRALEEERKRKQAVIFPIRLDDAVLDTSEAWAKGLRIHRHIGDFRHWKDHDGYKKSFERVLRDLKRAAEPPQQSGKTQEA